MRIWCYLFNVLFIKKILKNIPSKIPDIAIDSYLFEDCTLIIYPSAALKQGPLDP